MLPRLGETQCCFQNDVVGILQVGLDLDFSWGQQNPGLAGAGGQADSWRPICHPTLPCPIRPGSLMPPEESIFLAREQAALGMHMFCFSGAFNQGSWGADPLCLPVDSHAILGSWSHFMQVSSRGHFQIVLLFSHHSCV